MQQKCVSCVSSRLSIDILAPTVVAEHNQSRARAQSPISFPIPVCDVCEASVTPNTSSGNVRQMDRY